MSYGMMIAVQMNKKEAFDALWNWSHTYMYHADTNHPSYGYFSWEMNYDGDWFTPYLFMVIHAVDYNRRNGKFATSELDFFLGKNFLVTYHQRLGGNCRNRT